MKSIMVKKALLLFTGCLVSATIYAGDRRTCRSGAPGEDIYKHYTGTIGGRKVIVDLRYGFCGASNYGGSYIYDVASGNVTRLIIGEPESFAHSATLQGSEIAPGDDWTDHTLRESAARWTFTIGDNNLTGKCSVNNKDVDINLTEDYSNATSLGVSVFTDSMKTMRPGKPMAALQYSYIGVEPAATVPHNSAVFLQEQMAAMAGTKKLGINSLGAMVAQNALNNFKTTYEQLPADTNAVDWKLMKRTSSHTVLMPVYNNNGILTLECSSFGLANGTYATTTIHRNLDMKTRKVWTIDNVIEAKLGRQKLINLLKASQNAATAKATKETVPAADATLPEDMIITNGGILFLAKGASSMPGPGYTYIPYAKLKGILAPDFAKRMGV